MNKFLKEILEQPDAIDNTLEYYISSDGKKALEKLKKKVDSEHFEQIIFTGMGSSYFASHAASTLFNSMGTGSFSINSSELLHYNMSLLKKKTLLISFSQSGESFEVKELLQTLPSGVFCAGITNEAKSTLAKKADLALLTCAGREEMTSTKTYISTSLVAFISGWYLNGSWNNDKVKMIRQMAEHFRSELNEGEPHINKMLSFFGDIQTIQVIARGPAFSTASQTALMFKEATRIPATGILGGEFRHGPMEMVTDGFKSVLFAPQGNTYLQSVKMAEDISDFGGKVLVITNKKLKTGGNNLMQIVIDEPDEFLFSLHSILPMQLFIDAYAKVHGFEAGSFSRGNKITSIE